MHSYFRRGMIMRVSNFMPNSAITLKGHLVLKAIKTALVVGSVLLLINQYEAVFGLQPINWLKACLSYCVPFSVFLYGKLSQN